MSKPEDWRSKFEQSEAARLKLREALGMLKEKALNTERLVQQHNQLKEELKAEAKAKRKAENSAAKLKQLNEGMQKTIESLDVKLQGLVEQVQQLSTILYCEDGRALGGGAVERAGLVTRTEMAALQAQVAGHDKQLRTWNKAMKEVQGGGSGGGGGGSGKKRAAPAPITAGGGAGPSVEEDPVRSRAVAMLKANKKEAAAKGQQQQRQQPPPKKRVRLSEDPGQLQQQFIGGSAGGSEAAPPGFADVAIAALRAVMGADAEQPPSTAAVQDAVKILNPLETHNSLSNGGEDTSNPSVLQKRNIVTAFACAVLECAAAAPAQRFAATSLSPRHWFEATPGGKKASGSSSKDKKGKNMSLVPSFIGVWCSRDVIQRHSLPWLLHCALEVSTATATAAAAASEGEEEEVKEEEKTRNLCQVVAKDLALLVIKDLATSSSRSLLHTPTELCAAAAAAGALWQSQGDFRSFQVFILDILLSKLDGNEIDVLAPLAAAIESWPEALFSNKGALGGGVHGLLQYLACIAGKNSRVLETRLAATWLHKLGVEEWNWSEELSDEDVERAVVEARKQLAKFKLPPSSLAAKPVSEINYEFI